MIRPRQRRCAAKPRTFAARSAACSIRGDAVPQGHKTNRIPFDNTVVFGLGGSRIHNCASKLCPANLGFPKAPGLFAMNAFQSCEKLPVHPVVPPELLEFMRCVG